MYLFHKCSEVKRAVIPSKVTWKVQMHQINTSVVYKHSVDLLICKVVAVNTPTTSPKQRLFISTFRLHCFYYPVLIGNNTEIQKHRRTLKHPISHFYCFVCSNKLIQPRGRHEGKQHGRGWLFCITKSTAKPVTAVQIQSYIMSNFPMLTVSNNVAGPFCRI